MKNYLIQILHEINSNIQLRYNYKSKDFWLIEHLRINLI